MEAIEELAKLAGSMSQAAAVLADEDVDEKTPSKHPSTFLNAVALGNVGAGKSAVLNSLIGHPVLPTGENGATRAPINIDLQRDPAVSRKSIVLQSVGKSQEVSASSLRHSLQDMLSKGSGKKSGNEIQLNLRTSTAPPLKLTDLPGLDQRAMDESVVSDYAARNDAILLVVIPAAQAPEISSSRALRLAKEYDAEGTRTIGVISKIDQAAGDQKSLAASQALLLNQGPAKASDIPWVALIGQSVSIASSQGGSVGAENSMETAWRAETESLRSILTGAPQTKLGRLALVDTLAMQIRNRMKVRLPNLLSGLQGKSQKVKDELVMLGEQFVQSAEGTRAIALQLCREFEDMFLQHIATGEGGGWKVVASFEGNFPNRIKQLPLDKHFDIKNVKRIVLEADGYQPYLISPEKGLRSLIKGVLELAKEPSRLCVDEVAEIIASNKFWDNTNIALKVFTPLVKVLRRVDGDKVPSMGFLYGDLETAKEEIRDALGGLEKKYLPIWKIIDKRWEEKLKGPLHRAGYFLNPLYYYAKQPEIDADGSFMSGFVAVMHRFYPNDHDRIDKIAQQLPMYQNQNGSFGMSFARAAVKRIINPAQWWQFYGTDAPELRIMTMRILSLTTSSSGCEQNWSTFEMVHRLLIEIVSAAAKATPGLGRYPPFKNEVIAVASSALERFRNEAKMMVVALVDMERAFVPPQHFIRLVQRRMDRQRREEEVKYRSSKKGQEAEHVILNRATSPQSGSQQTGGSLKSMKDKSSQPDKDGKEGSGLQIAGPGGEITAGFLLKKSGKTSGWSRRWFVLNEKSGKLGYTKKQEERHFRGVITLEECNIEEIDEDEISKSSKDSKKKGDDSGKGPSLVFKITSKVQYKTVLKAHSALILKAESVADKVEWVNKIGNVIQPSKGMPVKGLPASEGGGSIRHSQSDGSLDTMERKPADPEEELRWMSQEVRGYVEAVLNSLAANVPKAVVLCQVEKAKDDMLNQLYTSISSQSTARIEELIQEDQNVKVKRERIQRQSSLLSKLTHQLSVYDNCTAAATCSDSGTGTESSPRSNAPGDEWKTAFDSSGNSVSRSSSSAGHSRHYSDPEQNGGDESNSSSSSSRRTPNRLPPAPPQGASSSVYK